MFDKRRVGILAGLCLLVIACDPGDSSLVDPAPPEDATSLIVRALVESSESQLAAALGWQAGIAGLEVKIHRLGEPYDPDFWTVAVTDSEGRARFADLVPGSYEVVTRRVLTADEAARIGGVVRAFAGGDFVGSPSATEAELRLSGDSAGSLVFSELALMVPPPWETGGGSYYGGKYIELYNNSDSTIYLDRKILGIAWDIDRDITEFWPCSETSRFREDSLGLWSRLMLQFPGAGAQYPIAPGKAVLIAALAEDHRPVHPSLLDLRHADFEFLAAGSADNPDAANLRDIGLSTWLFNRPQLSAPLFIADPVDITGLPRARDGYSGVELLRIPAEKILDVTAARWDWTKSDGYTARPLCGATVHPVFDRLNGPPLSSAQDVGRSATRRVLRHEGERIVLQDTNTSMADFVLAEPTPGIVR